MLFWAVALLSSSFACGRFGFDSQPDACEGLTCGGHGSCQVTGGVARCHCEPGYFAQGATRCVEGRDPCDDAQCGAGACVVDSSGARCACGAGLLNDGPRLCVTAMCETDLDCDDFNPCTDDRCVSGGCDHVPNVLRCDDGDPCTTTDRCAAGVCSGDYNTCDDGDAMTEDACLGDGTCAHVGLPEVPSALGGAVSCIEPQSAVPSTVGGMGQALFATDGFVYLGLSESTHGIQIYAAVDGSPPVARGVFRTDVGEAMLDGSRNDVLGVYVHGGLAYLATYRGGLLIVDVSDPDDPVLVGGLDLPTESWAVWVRGGLAYVANHSLGLAVVDVSVPTRPALVRSVGLRGAAQDVHLVGDTVYTTSLSHLGILDASDPSHPVLLSELPFGDLLYEVTSAGDGYAYVVDKTGGRLFVVDVSNPSAPAVLFESPMGDTDFRSLDLWGELLFVGTGRGPVGALRVYDVSEPGAPLLLAEASTEERLFEVAVIGGTAYGAAGSGTLVALDARACRVP